MGVAGVELRHPGASLLSVWRGQIEHPFLSPLGEHSTPLFIFTASSSVLTAGITWTTRKACL